MAIMAGVSEMKRNRKEMAKIMKAISPSMAWHVAWRKENIENRK
jgi:hypothetical protein